MHNTSQYETLAALLGSTYGGNGTTTFGLPDSRGRVAIGITGSYPLGILVGQETVSLNGTQVPQHNHLIEATRNGAGSPGTDPTKQVFAANVAVYAIVSSPTFSTMQSSAIGSAGQGLPHENGAPTLPLRACICYDGVWPANSN